MTSNLEAFAAYKLNPERAWTHEPQVAHDRRMEVIVVPRVGRTRELPCLFVCLSFVPALRTPQGFQLAFERSPVRFVFLLLSSLLDL